LDAHPREHVRAVGTTRRGERARTVGPGDGAARAELDALLGDEQAPLFSVGQVSELVGMQPGFLRRLDSMGVVSPTRNGGDHRRYSRADIRRLLDARALMRDGVSVVGVRHVFELKDRVVELEEALRAARSGVGRRRPSRPLAESGPRHSHRGVQ
jgi:DNA-binding transcriptional MerR regulator